MKAFSVSKAFAVVVLAGLVLLPLYSSLSGNIFVLTLFTRIVILALAAASLNLIMGYGGMMSFGHAAYLGIGGYAVGILAQEGIGSGFIQFPVALETHLIDGGWASKPFTNASNGSTTGSIIGEWNACETCSRRVNTCRLANASSSSLIASSGPETTH